MSWYSHYTGQSIGRILHFLYVYGGLQIAEHCIVDNNVKYFGKILATSIKFETVEVEGLNGWKFISHDVPVFEFTPEYAWLDKMQKEKQRIAILKSVVHEAMARVKTIEKHMSDPQRIIRIYSHDGKATWDWENNPSVIQAKNELLALKEKHEIATRELKEIYEHEFDYSHL